MEYKQNIVNTTLHNKTYIPNKPKRNYNWLWLFILGLLFIGFLIVIDFVSSENNSNIDLLVLDNSKSLEYIIYFDYNNISYNIIDMENFENNIKYNNINIPSILFNNSYYSLEEYKNLLKDADAKASDILNQEEETNNIIEEHIIKVNKLKNNLFKILIFSLILIGIIYGIYYKIKNKTKTEWNDED